MKHINVRKRVIKGHTYWIARLTFPIDKRTGRAPTPKDFSAKTQREAVEKRRAYLETWQKNPKADTISTFGFYLENDFLAEQLRRTTLNRATSKDALSWAKYAERKSRILKLQKDTDAKRLLSTTVAELEPEHFSFYLKKKEQQLSASKFNKCRRDLQLALKGLLGKTRLPISEILLHFPRPATERPAKKSLPDIDSLLQKINDEQYPLEYRALVAFELVVNCRPQEIMPLTWSDIDWSAGTVTINKRLAQVRPQGKSKTAYQVIPGSKTDPLASRVVPLGSLLLPLLKALQKARMANTVGSIYVFPAKGGKILTKMGFYRKWKQILTAMKISGQFYWLKTAGNSYALSQGVAPEAQAAKMGHSSITMARTAYRVVSDAELARSVEVFGG